MENHEKIIFAVGELKGTVDTGFKAINKRLDTNNGHTASHAKRINVVEGEQKYQKGRSAGISFVVSFVITGIGLLINYLK